MTRPPFFAPGVIERHRAPARRHLRHLAWALARAALVLAMTALAMAALWRWL